MDQPARVQTTGGRDGRPKGLPAPGWSTSSPAATDCSFGALSQGQQRYTPFGTSRDSGASIPTDHLFTSQVRDASIGLYWYASRGYDPALGRFCQPDSLVPSPGDPQSLNRYAYVRNNPLRLVDPSGRTPLSPQQISELNEKGIVDRFGNPVDERAAAMLGTAWGGVDFVLFIGGFNTDDLGGTATEWAAYTAQLGGWRGFGSRYGYFDWGTGERLPLPSSKGSVNVPVAQAVNRLVNQLEALGSQGFSRIGLVGHSKGGTLIAEYLAQVAAGTQANRGVVAAVTLSSPLGSNQWSESVGWRRRDAQGNDRLANVGTTGIRTAFVHNPADTFSAAGPAAQTVWYLDAANQQRFPRGPDPYTIHGQVLREPLVVDFVGGFMRG